MKWRLFRCLHSGKDDDAIRVYEWHIDKRIGPRMRAGLATDQWKRKVDDYYFSAHRLYESMKDGGFFSHEPIPADPDGELLGGAHRLACALALGIESVPVQSMPQRAWAPPWHREWFIEQGMERRDIERLDADWAEMNA